MVRRLAHTLIALAIVLLLVAGVLVRASSNHLFAGLPDLALLIGLLGGGVAVVGENLTPATSAIPPSQPSPRNSVQPEVARRRKQTRRLRPSSNSGRGRGWGQKLLPLRRLSIISVVWLIGMAGALIGMFDADLRVLIAFPVTTLALLYWLMTRFASVQRIWLTLSLQVTVGLVAVAGGCLYLAGESALGALAIPLCLLIVAAHSYHAFSNQNGSRTLAAHWAALTVLLWIGVGLLGGIATFPEIYPTVRDTLIPDVIRDWLRAATLAIILGMGNQVTADMRGENRRITGLSAYWLIAFGVIVGGILRLCAGTAQAYLVSLYGLEPLAVHDNQLAPLLIIAGTFDLAALLGMAIYAVQFWVRRPRISDSGEPK